MRRAGINDAYVLVGEANGFARGLVWQTQDGEIGGVHGLRPGGRGFSVFIAQLHHLEARLVRQAFAYLQAGRARGAIDEDFDAHDRVSLRPALFPTWSGRRTAASYCIVRARPANNPN